jgi:uncharacterized protein YjiS (DUF1127 family)
MPGLHSKKATMTMKPHTATQMPADLVKDEANRTRAVIEKTLSGWWRGLCHWSDRRRQRRQLGALEDHLLKDIGITRDQARREACRWFLE